MVALGAVDPRNPRRLGLVPLPFREPAEGYEADDGDDDAEQDAPDQRDDDSCDDENAAEADPAQRPDPRVSVGVVVIDRSFVVSGARAFPPTTGSKRSAACAVDVSVSSRRDTTISWPPRSTSTCRIISREQRSASSSFSAVIGTTKAQNSPSPWPSSPSRSRKIDGPCRRIMHDVGAEALAPRWRPGGRWRRFDG